MSASTRTMILGLALAASLLLGVTSAQAANHAPNPSFETECGGVPCNWTNVAGGAISWDTSVAYTGVASLKETSDASGNTPGAATDCIPVPADTDVTRSFWYLTTSAFVDRIAFNIKFYASSDCSDSTAIGPANLMTFAPNADGQWHQLQDPFMLTVFPGNAGAVATLFFLCPASCPADTVVHFDDVILGSGPLAVELRSLTGRSVHEGVLLRWRTGTEADLLGFQVYRSRGHSWRRMSRSLVAAKGSVSGASYRFLDRTAGRGVSYRYRIKAVNRDGTTAWFGPLRVT